MTQVFTKTVTQLNIRIACWNKGITFDLIGFVFPVSKSCFQTNEMPTNLFRHIS